MSITEIGNGWTMVEPIDITAAASLYDGLDNDELGELAALDIIRDEFILSAVEADRSAAFYDKHGTLSFCICASTVDIPSFGVARLWDTMSTKAVRGGGATSISAFVKATPLIRDAFAKDEPQQLPIVGVVLSSFDRSRKWIERVVGFKEVHDIILNGHSHTIYVWNGRKEA